MLAKTWNTSRPAGLVELMRWMGEHHKPGALDKLTPGH